MHFENVKFICGFKVCLTSLLTSFLLFGSFAWADIYRYRDENGVWHFTNINNDKRYNLYIKSFASNPVAYIREYGTIIEQASQRFSMETSLIKAVIKAESDFNNHATSKKGAQGLMQLMPGTAGEMDVQDPYNPEENIFGGTRYLSMLLGRFNQNKELALAAYNAGPEKVTAYNGIPPFPETIAFVKRVLEYYAEYKSQ
jgi:soluble lytic murein transglycosylase